MNTTVAVALMLVVAGSASTMHRDGSVAAQLVTATSDGAAGEAAPASVTAVDPGTALAQPGTQLPPAIHIAATGPAVAHPVQVDVAQVLLDAYRSAVDGSPASCHLPVSLLAAIGEVESGSLAGRPIDAQHRTSVLGPVLNGNGFAAIADTDNGRWDGSARWDRAVGPMQFIPSTWRTFGVDGDGDGVADPQDVEDAAASTAGYLCFGGRDLGRAADVRSAILSYNHSAAYLNLVSTYQARYADLGLDDPTASGTPTTISLIATPVAAPMAAAPAAPAASQHARAASPRSHASQGSAHAVAASATTRGTRTKTGGTQTGGTQTGGTQTGGTQTGGTGTQTGGTQTGGTQTGGTQTGGSNTPSNGKPTGPSAPAGTPSTGGAGTPTGGQTDTPGSQPTAPSPTPSPTTGGTPPSGTATGGTATGGTATGGTATGGTACAPAQDATGDQPAAGATAASADPATPDTAQCPPCDGATDPSASGAATTGSTTGSGGDTAPSGGATAAPAAGDQTGTDATCAPVTAASPSAAP